MKPDAARALIAAGETLAVEFKGEERAPLRDRDLVEAVICLANRAGGEPAWLFVGVEDDGRITGARPRHGAVTVPARVAASIANRSRPSLSVHVENVVIGDKTVLVIEAPPQRQPVSTSEGVFLRRVLGGDGRPACAPMDVFAMQSLQADRGLLDPSAQAVADARWEDLDFVRLLVTEAQGAANSNWTNCSSSTPCGKSAASAPKTPSVSFKNPTQKRALRCIVWSKQGLSKNAARKRAAPGIFPLRSIGCSATRPPTCASAASSRSNRSRWCCNMWKSTAGSRDVRRRSCAESGLTRPRDC